MILRGKVLILTGVGAGMGSQLALQASREGAHVVLAARSGKVTEPLAQQINAAGGQAIAHRADVSVDSQCESLAAEAIRRFGRIDGLTNAAYIFGDAADAVDADPLSWNKTMDVVCFGALRMAKAVAPAMRAQKSGSIVNVGSMVTRKPPPQRGDYTVAKAALVGLTRQLAQELGPHGVRVNTASIGWMWGVEVQRVMKEFAASQNRTEESMIAEVAARIPLGQIPTEEDCANSILFLLSDYSRAITGAHLDVNGGELLGAF